MGRVSPPCRSATTPPSIDTAIIAVKRDAPDRLDGRGRRGRRPLTLRRPAPGSRSSLIARSVHLASSAFGSGVASDDILVRTARVSAGGRSSKSIRRAPVANERGPAPSRARGLTLQRRAVPASELGRRLVRALQELE